MSATATRKPRTVKPVRCEVVTYRRMAYPCTLLPAGQPAHVAINGKPYVVTFVGTPASSGHPIEGDAFTFHSGTDSHTVCRGTCTCGDYIFTREPIGERCKHLVACERLQAEGTI